LFEEKGEFIRFEGLVKYRKKMVTSEVMLDKKNRCFVIKVKSNCVGDFNIHFAPEIDPNEYIKQGKRMEYWYSPGYGEKYLCSGKKICDRKQFEIKIQ
jgi:hypothetical protein